MDLQPGPPDLWEALSEVISVRNDGFQNVKTVLKRADLKRTLDAQVSLFRRSRSMLTLEGGLDDVNIYYYSWICYFKKKAIMSCYRLE
jgi:hypothetical protein